MASRGTLLESVNSNLLPDRGLTVLVREILLLLFESVVVVCPCVTVSCLVCPAAHIVIDLYPTWWLW